MYVLQRSLYNLPCTPRTTFCTPRSVLSSRRICVMRKRKVFRDAVRVKNTRLRCTICCTTAGSIPPVTGQSMKIDDVIYYTYPEQECHYYDLVKSKQINKSELNRFISFNSRAATLKRRRSTVMTIKIINSTFPAYHSLSYCTLVLWVSFTIVVQLRSKYEYIVYIP